MTERVLASERRSIERKRNLKGLAADWRLPTVRGLELTGAAADSFTTRHW